MNWPEVTLYATTAPGNEGLASFIVEDHIGFLLRREHQRHVSIFTSAMAQADLTPTQFTALLKVAWADDAEPAGAARGDGPGDDTGCRAAADGARTGPPEP